MNAVLETYNRTHNIFEPVFESYYFGSYQMFLSQQVKRNVIITC